MEAHPASVLINEVRANHPKTFGKILRLIEPHRIESVARILKDHIDNAASLDLNIFNENRRRIPRFVLRFVKRIVLRFPQAGDAFGIQLTCRITKNDTQDILDSRHLREKPTPHRQVRSRNHHHDEAYKSLKYELELFSMQSQVLEIAGRRKYSSIRVRNYSTGQLLEIFRHETGVLKNDTPLRLNMLRFIIVPPPDGDDGGGVHKIVYSAHARDLTYLLRHLDREKIVSFNDVKGVYQKCGISCYFFNMVKILRSNRENYDSRHLRDLLNVVRYQCRTGEPLPLNRDGLAKNPNRSPLEVLSFEAPKKNYVRLCTTTTSSTTTTTPPTGRRGGGGGNNYPVSTSTDKMFFGQQFNEGTGYHFSITK